MQSLEEQLIKGCLEQNRKAQRKLYERYAGLMLGVCIRYLKDRDESEDIMVNGFQKVFEKIGQYQGAGSFEGWLRRVFVNECLMHLRKKNRLFIPIDEKHEGVPGGEDLAISSLQAEELLELISQLPIGYKTVFNLYAIEGYGHKEIAERLGITEGTSKSQLNRARKLLQEWIQKREMVS